MNPIVPTYHSPPTLLSAVFVYCALHRASLRPWSIFTQVLFLLVFFTFGAHAANQPTIQGIRTISAAGTTRVIISLSAPIRYELLPEFSSKTATTPSRLHLRFSPAKIEPGTRTAAIVNDGILKEVRTGLLTESTVRVSLVLDQLGTYRATTYRSPDQIVIQLRKPTERRRIATQPRPSSRSSVSSREESREHRAAKTSTVSTTSPRTSRGQLPAPTLPVTKTQPKEPPRKESTERRVTLAPPRSPAPPSSLSKKSERPQLQPTRNEAKKSTPENEKDSSLEPKPTRADRSAPEPRTGTVLYTSPTTISNQERPVAPPEQAKEPLERQVALTSPRTTPVPPDPQPQEQPSEPLERQAALTPPRPAPVPLTPEPEEQPSEPVTQGERYRIMIDPGHGGSDPGATGVNGLQEKNVVLAVSKRLAQKLRKRLGAEVLLTRTTDVFIPLPERTARANAAKADLFVSIHANASPNSETHGIETYYLNNTNDRATIRLAKLENGIRAKQQLPERERTLSYILSDLIQTGKEEESIALAESIQTALVEQAQTTVSSTRDLGVKQGPFYVLVGAHMPCILVELAFLTHAEESQRLGSTAYQETLAEGLYLGIADFQRTGLSAKNL
jgi:N-acetylmuramoyl-L-alanine amidase